MAQQQYRIYGDFEWMSNSGNAIIAIYNPPGSGKKLTVNSLQAQNMTSLNPTAFGAAASPATMLMMARDMTVATGRPIAPSALDTNNTFPSSIKVSKGASCSGGVNIRRLAFTKQLLPGGLGWLGRNASIGNYNKYTTRQKGTSTSTVTNVVLRAGENLSVFPSTITSSQP